MSKKLFTVPIENCDHPEDLRQAVSEAQSAGVICVRCGLFKFSREPGNPYD